ncbi:ABC transporter ATP-binding protein [Vibrio porteresiae]|uniref:ABC transporter ATP-binding protein n=1 Tax=Vibrio porteresiae DSM 19223 TaxID=1123496 RepID=A0ABZ0Q7B3_9VIBR|nr:ABC transporter ATP-binding protein [Vibrio porteresiae]WPC72313.1 ABC transporter ATP-binding protein [Vibrio porteresiae DSM 19223]
MDKAYQSVPLLTARHLAFSYGQTPLISDVSLQVAQGEIVSLLGANGAGKSTLLQLLLGFLTPQQGEILLGDKPMNNMSRQELASHIAYVPQYHQCPFPYKVHEIIEMGCFARNGFLGKQSKEDRSRALTLLEEFQIAHLAHRAYTHISGGERQLVLLCRALMQGAKLLLLDEPASALDFGHQARFLGQLKRLTQRGISVLMSTHHPQHAQAIAQRVVLLAEGRLIQQGTPKEVLTCAAMAKLYGLSAQELALVMTPAVRGGEHEL